jgi:hypothetical protein
VFAVCAGDDRLVYSARQLQPNVVDIGFVDVRVEDPLQHYVARARRVDGRQRVVIQGVAVYYSVVPRYSA